MMGNKGLPLCFVLMRIIEYLHMSLLLSGLKLGIIMCEKKSNRFEFFL